MSSIDLTALLKVHTAVSLPDQQEIQINKMAAGESFIDEAAGSYSMLSYSPSPAPSPRDSEEETERWVGDSQIAYSCGHNAKGDANDTNLKGKQQLDFYFFYKVDLGLGGILDTRRFEISYVFNLASKLLSCTRDEKSAGESSPPYIILEVGSSEPDTLLELGLCSAPNTTASDRLCHIVDGSLSIFFDGEDSSDEMMKDIESVVTLELGDILSDNTFLSGTQPNILAASLILPVTTSLPSDQQLSPPQQRSVLSTSTIASFCAGLIASVLLLYATSRRLRKRGDGNESRGQRATIRNATRRSLLRLGVSTSGSRSLQYRDLDDMVLPIGGSAGNPAPTFASFDPIAVPSNNTEKPLEPRRSVVISGQTPLTTDTGVPYCSDTSILSPHEDPSRSSDESVGSVEDYSIAGGLHTIYEEEGPVGESLSF